MLRTALVTALVLLTAQGQAQATSVIDSSYSFNSVLQAESIGVGSIELAFTSYNGLEDGWSIVALSNIAANTKIYFTDSEKNFDTSAGAPYFNVGEGYYTWNTGASTIQAGTVVRFANVNTVGETHGSISSSVGILSVVGVGGTQLGSTSETLMAYLGTLYSPSRFLAGISIEGDFNLSDVGLQSGVDAVELPLGADVGYYVGPRSGLNSFADYRPLLSDPNNWDIYDNDNTKWDFVPNLTPFTLVPEPSSMLLSAAGLGMVALLGRRRAAA